MYLNMASEATTGLPSWISRSRWSQNIVKVSIRSVMSNLVGKVASFTFVAHLVQEILLFLVFNMALAAILDLKVKIVSKHNGYYSIRSVVPKLVGNDPLYAPLINLVQEISLFLAFNVALAAILKTGLLKYFPSTFGRCMGAYFSSNRFILSNQYKKLRFRKNGHGSKENDSTKG